MHTGLEGLTPSLLWAVEISFFFLSIFKEPALGLYALVPLLPLETVRYRIHGYFLGPQYVDVLLLGVMLGLRRRGLPIFPDTPIRKLLLVYIVFTYLSMIEGSLFLGLDLPFWFSDPRVSDWKNFIVDLSLIYLVGTSALRSKKQIGILLAAISIGSLLIAKNFHGSIGDRDFSSFSYNLRDAGTLGGAGVNGLAALTAQIATFTIALALVDRRLLFRLGYLTVIAGNLYCVLFALSRGAYAAVLAGVLFLGLLRNRFLLVCLFGFLLVWQSVVPSAVRDRVFMTVDENGEVEHSAAARLSLWDEAMQLFKADPIFGTGFNTYAYRSHVGGYGDTHNLYVKVLVETGVSGLCLFLAILWKLFQMGFRLYRSAHDRFFEALGLGFSVLILTAVIANFFGDRWMYFQITGYTYAFAAMVTRAQQLTNETEADAPAEEALEPERRLEPAG